MPFPPVEHRFSGGEGFPFLREYDACWNGCHGKGWCWSWCSVASPRLSLAPFFGYLPWFLLAAVTGLLVWHFWNLLRLSWWLWVDRSMTPPPGRGSWEPLLYGLHQMQLRNKKRRRELGNLIKRFRSGAESLPDAVVLTTEEGGIFLV